MQRLPNTDGNSSGMAQDTAHFAQRPSSIGKELESLLAEYEIKLLLSQFETCCIAFVPIYGGALGHRLRHADCQHFGVYIQCNYMPAFADERGNLSCNAARSAGEIQYALP